MVRRARLSRKTDAITGRVGTSCGRRDQGICLGSINPSVGRSAFPSANCSRVYDAFTFCLRVPGRFQNTPGTLRGRTYVRCRGCAGRAEHSRHAHRPPSHRQSTLFCCLGKKGIGPCRSCVPECNRSRNVPLLLPHVSYRSRLQTRSTPPAQLENTEGGEP